MINNEQQLIIEDVLDNLKFIQVVISGMNFNIKPELSLNNKVIFNSKPSEIDDHLTYGRIV